MADIVRRQIGKHLIEIEDDVLVSRLNGDFTLDDVMAFYALAREHGQQRPIYSIGDMTRAGSISADARRYAVENGHKLNFGATVSFGLNMPMRTLLTMLTRATELLGRGDSSAHMQFVATEQDARTYITNRRKKAGSSPNIG